ncbi:MAG: MFS transporter [Cyclobacteriaceae bacterium]|nr:MFS transporter [Cyclobacteriaceae bacterium HetDA_MAG_MS6]
MLIQKTETLKWREVYSLAALNAAVVISWIAYHEYQPILMEKIQITHLLDFLVVSKAIVLIVIPPFAGWLSDYILRVNGKYLIVFTVGIGATAMIFMVVATLASTHHLMDVKSILPFMIVLWLISMNLFISPANSMIEAFAPAQKLPIVIGFLFLITELLYALEPVIVSLVSFFGDTLTFIVGGVLIGTAGFIFHRVSSDEVLQRKQELLTHERQGRQSVLSYLAILMMGLHLGFGKGFLVEFLPEYFAEQFPAIGQHGDTISFILLGLSAILGFSISGWVAKKKLLHIIAASYAILVVGILVLVFSNTPVILIVASVIIAVSFTFINISGLPFAIQHLSVRHITYGIGIYIGASEIFTGILEYIYR